MLDLIASENRAFVQDLLAWSVCLAALIWGGGPERAIAATWLILFELIGGLFWSDALGYRFGDIDVFLASIDLVAGSVWIAVALYANRNYPLWIAAMQLMSMTAHLAKGLAESISSIAYAFMVVAPGWLQLLFLAIGLGRHIQRKQRFGNYRDWRITKPTSGIGPKRFTVGPQNGWLSREGSSWRDDLK